MVIEEITSPELVLVSPPELAALARDALPDYELEFEEWTLRVRAALETEAQLRVQVQEPPPEPEPRPTPGPSTFTIGALAFTVLSAAASVAPLVLVIAFR